MNNFKTVILMILLMIIVLISPTQVLADTTGSGYKTSGTGTTGGSYEIDYGASPCENEDVKNAVKVVGKVISIIQIVVPILLVIIAFVDITKSIVSGDEAKSKKNITTLVKRLISAAIVFFVIAIVKLVCQLAGNNTFDSCLTLISNPW